MLNCRLMSLTVSARRSTSVSMMSSVRWIAGTEYAPLPLPLLGFEALVVVAITSANLWVPILDGIFSVKRELPPFLTQHKIFQNTDAGNFNLHPVSGLQKHLRLAMEPNPRRRSRADHVSRLQHQRLRKRRNQRRRRKHQVPRVRMLKRLAVQPQADVQRQRVRN